MSAPTTTVSLVQAIDELGVLTSPDAVAEHLVNLQVRGYRNNCRTCPVALYLTQRTGTQVIVRPGTAHTDTHRDVRLPWVVIEFIRRFDEHVAYDALRAYSWLPSTPPTSGYTP